MKYDNFKILKFSTISKKINRIKDSFSRIYKRIEDISDNVVGISGYIIKYIFTGIYKNINVVKELDIPLQLFIITSNLDTPNYINKSQLLELNSFSQITISSHTHKHSILNKISESEIEIELKASKKLLENHLNKEYRLLWVWGRFTLDHPVVSSISELSDLFRLINPPLVVRCR